MWTGILFDHKKELSINTAISWITLENIIVSEIACHKSSIYMLGPEKPDL